MLRFMMIALLLPGPAALAQSLDDDFRPYMVAQQSERMPKDPDCVNDSGTTPGLGCTPSGSVYAVPGDSVPVTPDEPVAPGTARDDADDEDYGQPNEMTPDDSYDSNEPFDSYDDDQDSGVPSDLTPDSSTDQGPQAAPGTVETDRGGNTELVP